MTPAKSKVTPHLQVINPSVPRDAQGRDYCAVCSLAIVDGDPRHTLPPPVADVRQLAAHEEDA